MAVTNQQQAFLFMPDISGFSKFVNETEIEHSTHIIRELLEIIINANEINLELMEIEGDAVFFYRFGKTPGVHEIIQQSKNIFKKFHGHLLKYESQRICQCGACSTAGNLTLKFIIHKGIASSFRIGEHFKLMGKEIIILHRLLKNKIPENSYLLFTESLFTIFNDDYLKSKQLATTHYSEEFDDVLINYKYIPIDLWLQEIEPVGNGTHDLPTHFISALSVSKPIEAPATEVFTYITNLSNRAQWMEGTKSIEIISREKINQLDTVHNCILSDNSVLRFRSNEYEHTGNDYSIRETDSDKNNFAKQFSVEEVSSKKCIVKIQFLVRNKFFSKMMFSIFMKNRVSKEFRNSLEDLKMKLENKAN